MSKFLAIFLFLGVISNPIGALETKNSIGDSIPAGQFNTKQWVAPAALFTAGSGIAAIPSLRKLETRIYDGFNPKSKPQQQLLLYALRNITAAAIVQPMKKIVQRERPNSSDFRSFPSGHTSTAFVAAEFLHQEFGHHSPWISVSGYATAAATGYLLKIKKAENPRVMMAI